MSTTSANDTAARRLKSVNAAQVGTRHVANYIAPRDCYRTISSSNDYMVLQLLTIDQASLQCKEAVKAIMGDKTLYRGAIKRLVSQLYRGRTFPLPICNAVDQAIARNMTENEVMQFGVMASYIDDIIQPEMDKLINAVYTEVGRSGIQRQEVITRILCAHLFTIIAVHILERSEQLLGGLHFLLCLNPSDPALRCGAYRLSPADVKRMSLLTLRLTNDIIKRDASRVCTIRYTQEMESSVTIICNKICDVVNIYSACVEAEIDMSGCNFQDLRAIVERVKARRSGNQQQSPSDLAEQFKEKGWNVKQSAP